MKRPLLVVLTGPVGGGKSTTARALAVALRGRQRRVGVIDLDELYPMVQQDEPRYSDVEVWRVAYRAAAALVDSFVASGLDAVVVEAGFFTDEEREWLCAHLRSNVTLRFVTLEVSFEETVRRVTSDPSEDRVATRNPDVLRWHYEQFAAALPFLRATTATFDGDGRTADELAAAIAESLLQTESEPKPGRADLPP